MTEEDLSTSEIAKAEVAKFPFHQIIGKLWWIALISRPDIVYAVHGCAVWQNRPSKLMRRIIRIVKYSKGTKALGVVFDRQNFDPDKILSGFCDASFASERDSSSRYGVLF